MNFELGNLILGFFFGIIGISAWRYGKQNASARHMLLGVMLIAFTYFIPNFLVSLLVGIGLSIFLFWP